VRVAEIVTERAQPPGVDRRPVDERIRGRIQGGGTRRGWGRNKHVGRCGEKVGVRVNQTQEMTGKEGTADPGGLDTKRGRYSSGSGLFRPEKKVFLLQ